MELKLVQKHRSSKHICQRFYIMKNSITKKNLTTNESLGTQTFIMSAQEHYILLDELLHNS
jgi:hypothetical protein